MSHLPYIDSGLFFTQGDTAPDYTAILHDEDDVSEPLDLTDAEVYFQMRRPDDRRFTVNLEGEVDTPETDGKVRYSWGANDLAVPGEYDVQWKVIFPDGKIQHTETPVRITVRRE